MDVIRLPHLLRNVARQAGRELKGRETQKEGTQREPGSVCEGAFHSRTEWGVGKDERLEATPCWENSQDGKAWNVGKCENE